MSNQIYKIEPGIVDQLLQTSTFSVCQADVPPVNLPQFGRNEHVIETTNNRIQCFVHFFSCFCVRMYTIKVLWSVNGPQQTFRLFVILVHHYAVCYRVCGLLGGPRLGYIPTLEFESGAVTCTLLVSLRRPNHSSSSCLHVFFRATSLVLIILEYGGTTDSGAVIDASASGCSTSGCFTSGCFTSGCFISYVGRCCFQNVTSVRPITWRLPNPCRIVV